MKCACKVYEVRDTIEVVVPPTGGTHSAALCCWNDELDQSFRTVYRSALAVEALRDRTTNY